MTNKFKGENIQIKTKIQTCQQELSKKERIIEELLSQAQPGRTTLQRPNKETNLIKSLKKLVKEIKVQLKEREEEIGSLKRNIKLTQMQEMEIEKQMFSDECTRLSHIIEELMEKGGLKFPHQIEQLESQFGQQNDLLTKIRRENEELARGFSVSDEEIKKWKEIVHELEKRNVELDANGKFAAKTKKQLRDSNREIQKLKGDSSGKSYFSNHIRIPQLEKQLGELEIKILDKEEKLEAVKRQLVRQKEREMTEKEVEDPYIKQNTQLEDQNQVLNEHLSKCRFYIYSGYVII